MELLQECYSVTEKNTRTKISSFKNVVSRIDFRKKLDRSSLEKHDRLETRLSSWKQEVTSKHHYQLENIDVSLLLFRNMIIHLETSINLERSLFTCKLHN